MEFSALPTTAFIRPDGKNQVAIASLLHQVVDLLVETMAQAVERSPLPESLDATAWAEIPEHASEINGLLEQLRSQPHQPLTFPIHLCHS